MHFLVYLILSCMLFDQWVVNAAFVYENMKVSHTNQCASDLLALSKGINTLQATLHKENILQVRHDHQHIQKCVQRAENSCCLPSPTNMEAPYFLQTMESISGQIDTLLSLITTKIQDSNFLLLKIVALMELEQVQMKNILHVDTCIASSLAASNISTYKRYTSRIQKAFLNFKATSLLL